MRIDGLSWRAGDEPGAPSDDGAGVEDGDDRLAPAAAGGEPRREPEVPFRIGLVSARIEPFDGDYRAAVDTVRELAGVLAASPGVEHVRVTRPPLDLSSGQTLSGDTGTSAETAEFELRVALRGPASHPAGA